MTIPQANVGPIMGIYFHLVCLITKFFLIADTTFNLPIFIVCTF